MVEINPQTNSKGDLLLSPQVLTHAFIRPSTDDKTTPQDTPRQVSDHYQKTVSPAGPALLTIAQAEQLYADQKTPVPELTHPPQLSPSFQEVKTGAVLKRGQAGNSIREMQHRLTKVGFPVQDTGIFGPTTESVLKAFQRARGIQETGQLGLTTLQALEKAEEENNYNHAKAQQLAGTAAKVARNRDTVGQCYSAVADSVDWVIGPFLKGMSAYMAADQLAENSQFKEIHLKPDQLPKLPAGAIVVWGKTHASPNGHISVSLGNGQEASDHIEAQHTNLRGYQNFRVFLPVG